MGRALFFREQALCVCGLRPAGKSLGEVAAEMGLAKTTGPGTRRSPRRKIVPHRSEPRYPLHFLRFRAILQLNLGKRGAGGPSQACALIAPPSKTTPVARGLCSPKTA